MQIQLIFRNEQGDDLTHCTVCGDTPEQVSEVITHVLLEVYAQHGPGVSIQQLPTIR